MQRLGQRIGGLLQRVADLVCVQQRRVHARVRQRGQECVPEYLRKRACQGYRNGRQTWPPPALSVRLVLIKTP